MTTTPEQQQYYNTQWSGAGAYNTTGMYNGYNGNMYGDGMYNNYPEYNDDFEPLLPPPPSSDMNTDQKAGVAFGSVAAGCLVAAAFTPAAVAVCLVFAAIYVGGFGGACYANGADNKEKELKSWNEQAYGQAQQPDYGQGQPVGLLANFSEADMAAFKQASDGINNTGMSGIADGSTATPTAAINSTTHTQTSGAQLS